MTTKYLDSTGLSYFWGKIKSYVQQHTPSGATVTLTVNGWSSKSQTVTVTGVTSSNTVIVSPSPSSMEDYVEAGIVCTAQGTNTLTFECDTTPSSAIDVNVVII